MGQRGERGEERIEGGGDDIKIDFGIRREWVMEMEVMRWW